MARLEQQVPGVGDKAAKRKYSVQCRGVPDDDSGKRVFLSFQSSVPSHGSMSTAPINDLLPEEVTLSRLALTELWCIPHTDQVPLKVSRPQYYNTPPEETGGWMVRARDRGRRTDRE